MYFCVCVCVFFFRPNVLLRFQDPVISFHFVCNEYEPAHDKTNKLTCAPSEDSDKPGQPMLISLRCPPEESLGPKLPIKHILKTAQTGHLCLCWAHRSFYWFCHVAAHFVCKEHDF